MKEKALIELVEGEAIHIQNVEGEYRTDVNTELLSVGLRALIKVIAKLWPEAGKVIDVVQGDKPECPFADEIGKLNERLNAANIKLAIAQKTYRALQEITPCLANWMEIADPEDVREYDKKALSKARLSLEAWENANSL